MSIAMKIPVHGIFNYKIFFLFYSFFVMDFWSYPEILFVFYGGNS